jgi:4a-hydroxytetrahydrobiopterin dehydratase
MNDLVRKKCIPCEEGTPPLSIKESKNLLHKVGQGWTLNDRGHLYKAYKFTDFRTAMTFANRVAKISEEEAHHPDLNISWGHCVVEIWTHKISGLTESDFILATKIETVYE